MRAYTPAEKLAAVERAIEIVRMASSAVTGVSVRDPRSEHHDTYNALKAIAADLRAALGKAER